MIALFCYCTIPYFMRSYSFTIPNCALSECIWIQKYENMQCWGDNGNPKQGWISGRCAKVKNSIQNDCCEPILVFLVTIFIRIYVCVCSMNICSDCLHRWHPDICLYIWMHTNQLQITNPRKKNFFVIFMIMVDIGWFYMWHIWKVGMLFGALLRFQQR